MKQDNLQGHGEGDGQEHAHDAPDPAPHYQGYENHQGTEVKLVTLELGIQDVPH